MARCPPSARSICCVRSAIRSPRPKTTRAGAPRHQAGQHLRLPLRRRPRLRQGARLRHRQGRRTRRRSNGDPVTQRTRAAGNAGVHRPRAGARSSGEIDGRADIYATRLRRLLAVDRAARVHAPTRRSASCCITRTRRPCRLPSAREVPIPPALDQLVMSCLAKDPARRPQSARELSRRLAEIPVATPWSEERAESWWTRHEPVVSTATDD